MKRLALLLLLCSCEKTETTNISEFHGHGKSVSIEVGQAKSVTLNATVESDSMFRLRPVAIDGETHLLILLSQHDTFTAHFSTGNVHYNLPRYNNNGILTLEGSRTFNIKGTKEITR